MNKRIKELIQECESFGDWETKRYTFDKEKFTELIVRECANIAAKNQTEDMDWDIGEIIKEHFGIKE